MRKFEVEIVYDIFDELFSRVYEVEAENEAEAESLALDMAHNDISDICINVENVNFVDEVKEDEKN